MNEKLFVFHDESQNEFLLTVHINGMVQLQPEDDTYTTMLSSEQMHIVVKAWCAIMGFKEPRRIT